jgi:hypothetical protein
MGRHPTWERDSGRGVERHPVITAAINNKKEATSLRDVAVPLTLLV